MDSCSPSSGIAAYHEVVNALYQQFLAATAEKEHATLLVNTCGWVDGLGKDLQLDIIDTIQPHQVITMVKQKDFVAAAGQAPTNEFSREVQTRQNRRLLENRKQQPIEFIDVINDSYEM